MHRTPVFTVARKSLCKCHSERDPLSTRQSVSPILKGISWNYPSPSLPCHLATQGVRPGEYRQQV